MTLVQLRYFLAVAECGGFTPAAAREGVTQPSLSEQVIRLEGDAAGLGRKLFERRPGRVVLTAAGRALLPHARAILERAAAARLDVANCRDAAVSSLTD